MENQFKTASIERPPIFSKSIALSKDKKWLIIKTIRTDILHVNYFKKILEGDSQ